MKNKFAPQKKVKKFHDEVRDFVGNIFGYDIDGIFISDVSLLEDFIGVLEDVNTMDAILEKINKLYKLDVSSIKDTPIVDIVAYMKEKGAWKK